MNDNSNISVIGFLKIYDPTSNEVLVEKNNSIHYENISKALADSLSNRGYGRIHSMAFGNGASSVDATGIITYLPTNTIGQNSSLYNKTFSKIVDDSSALNSDPVRNKISVSHTNGKVYTDIVIQCLLDYSEPTGQLAFDNSSNASDMYTFDELGIQAYYGKDANGSDVTRLLTHVVFHPIQKSLNRQLQIDYTIRIQSLTNLITQ